MVKVYYNGQDVFSGIAPTPFVGVDDEFINYRDRFGMSQNITLEGQITGNCKDFSFFVNQQNRIVSGFAQDFKTLDIKEETSGIQSFSNVKINSINFAENVYNGIVPFTINLSCYNSGFFTGVFGILEPENKTTYTEEKDESVKISRSFSAKGFNTATVGNNALTNAINYVQSITGTANLISPYFITGYICPLIPMSISETIDRINSTYTVNIDYTYGKDASSPIILSYTTDISYDEENGVYNVNLKGSLDAPIGVSMTDLRNEYTAFKNEVYSILLTILKQNTGYDYLNPTPLSYNPTENEVSNSIEFSFSYSTDPYTIKFDTNYNLDYNYVQDLYTLGVKGTLTSKGAQAARTALLEAELSKIDIKSLANSFYKSNVPNSVPLNTNYKNYSVDRNKTVPEISISADFDNTPIPPNGFRSFNYSIAITPSFYIYEPIQYLNGDNGIFNMNYYKRGQVSVNGTAIVNNNSDQSSAVRTQALALLDTYVAKLGGQNRLRTADSVNRSLTSTDEGYVYTFTMTDTCETEVWS